MKIAFTALVVAAGISSSASGAFVLIDDFESSTLGSVNTQNGWVADTNVGSTLYAVVTDPIGGSNQVLQLGNPGSDKNARLPLGTNAIASNTTGTLFMRVNFKEMSNNTLNANFGLTHNDSPAGFGDFNVQLALDNTEKLKAKDGSDTKELRIADGTATADVPGQWYNLWIVVDHTSDTYRVFIQSDSDSDFTTQTEVFANGSTTDPLGFRANPGTNAIDNLWIRSSQGLVFWDDFYIDNTGMNLANPVPEPASVALVGLGGLMVTLRRRRA